MHIIVYTIIKYIKLRLEFDVFWTVYLIINCFECFYRRLQSRYLSVSWAWLCALHSTRIIISMETKKFCENWHFHCYRQSILLIRSTGFFCFAPSFSLSSSLFCLSQYSFNNECETTQIVTDTTNKPVRQNKRHFFCSSLQCI